MDKSGISKRSDTVYSDLKVFYHTDKIECLKENRRTAPVYIRIKPTNLCNQRCYYCIYNNDIVWDERSVNRKESIPWEKMQEIIKDIAEMGVRAVTFTGGGDPLCYHSIIPTLQLVKRNQIDFALITNGQALEGDVAKELCEAKWVRISLDSAKSETYKRIRRVETHQKVLDNIANFAISKVNSCVLGINFVVTKENYDQIFDMCRIAKSLGVNNIKFSPIVIREKTAEYHKEIHQMVEKQLINAKKELVTDKFTIIDKYTCDLWMDKCYQKYYKKCYVKELFTIIAADQKVYYCIDKAYIPSGIVGDIREQSFKDMWFSEETTRKFHEMDASVECNFRCVYDERNILLNDLLNQDKNHINFI